MNYLSISFSRSTHFTCLEVLVNSVGLFFSVKCSFFFLVGGSVVVAISRKSNQTLPFLVDDNIEYLLM